MRDQMQKLLVEAKSGQMASFARLLTLIDENGAKSLQLPELLEPSHQAFRIGITGPPGAGKSTLISELLQVLVQKKLKIGVIAVDPTSPISQGAILGDRIRFTQDGLHENVFVRSLGTRGSLGGLSAASYLMLRAFDACEFDIVIIETVGVGQVEVEIMNVADYVCLVLVPESGDSVQTMKAGIMEVADLFVVNKSDRPGAESIKREIESQYDKKVLLVSALQKKGISEISDLFFEAKKSISLSRTRNTAVKLQAEAFALMRYQIEAEAKKRISAIKSQSDLRDLLAK